MSTQHALSRRETLSLLGIIAGIITVPASTPDTVAARSPEPYRAALVQPQYIFGYGSLIERESRMSIWSSAELASPVIVKGLARGWFDQTDVPSWSPTFVGDVAATSAECNGVIFPVTSAAL
jgi:hypothetical protein